MMAACSSCSAPVVWAKTDKGKSMPVDTKPVAGGNIEMLYPDSLAGTPTARYVAAEPGVEKYVSHFVTCPNAQKHRKPR